MNKAELKIERFIKKEEEGSYFLLPFEVPEDVEKVEITYDYTRFSKETKEDNSTVCKEINIVDLGLNGVGGSYIGSSGSDRSSIYISAVKSSQGFAAMNTGAGKWSIIVGAYKVQDCGCMVTYHIIFTKKELRLLKGDTHMHTLGSDGTLSVAGVAQLGKQLGLDFIFVTDHNNYAHNFQNVDVDGITVIPGTEWTHYRGHAGLLGVKKPFESAFCVNSLAEAQEKLTEAKKNGALLILNHPFCPNCGWKWGIENFEYDAIEIWNGGLSISANLKCLEWWQDQLLKQRKIPIVGGSDFHSLDVLRLMGMPCICVYAKSNTNEDIIRAIRNGNSYISLFTKGPDLYAEAGGKILGETAIHGSELTIRFWNLKTDDLIRIITDQGTEEIICGEGAREMDFKRKYNEAKFCRFEIMRNLTPEFERMMVLISNPIYFD
jgi:histidinol phosphatase-like PHP family hydrolase